MAATVTIEIDDAGAATVTIDGGEPYQCSSIDECLEYLEQTLKGEGAEDEAEMPEADAEAMWNEEAAKRPPQASLMA